MTQKPFEPSKANKESASCFQVTRNLFSFLAPQTFCKIFAPNHFNAYCLQEKESQTINQFLWKKRSYQLHLSNKLLSYLWNKFFFRALITQKLLSYLTKMKRMRRPQKKLFFCFCRKQSSCFFSLEVKVTLNHQIRVFTKP